MTLDGHTVSQPRREAAPGGAVRMVSCGSLAAAGLASLFAPRAVASARWAPLLGGLIITGMPHGAIDHLIPGQLRGDPLSTGSMAGLLAGYAALATGGVALWLAAPRAGVAALLALAAAHWGQGEIWFLVRVEGRAAPRDLASYCAIVTARGLLPILGPLLANPTEIDEAIALILKPFRSTSPVRLPRRLRPAASITLGGAVLAALFASWRDGPAGRRSDIAEIAGLVAFVAVTPPVFAIGVYFVAWHAPRHLARLAALQTPAPHPWGQLALDATPFTTLALAGIAGIAVKLKIDPDSPRLTGVALAVIFGLTIPHSLLVVWMDHRQQLLPAPHRLTGLRFRRPRWNGTGTRPGRDGGKGGA